MFYFIYPFNIFFFFFNKELNLASLATLLAINEELKINLSNTIRS